MPTTAQQVFDYSVDACQRTILFGDVLRRRSDQYYEQRAQPVPHVLNFDAELVLDARTFQRAANYLLVRVKPLTGVAVDPKKRPLVVHPAYLVGFTPEPMPGRPCFSRR